MRGETLFEEEKNKIFRFIVRMEKLALIRLSAPHFFFFQDELPRRTFERKIYKTVTNES